MCLLPLLTSRNVHSSHPQADSGMEIGGQCDTSASPAWCQRKSHTVRVTKPWAYLLALRRKQFWFSADVCFCDSNSVKQRAMKAVKEQVCGNSDQKMKAQPKKKKKQTKPNQTNKATIQSNSTQNSWLFASCLNPSPSNSFVLLIWCLTPS